MDNESNMKLEGFKLSRRTFVKLAGAAGAALAASGIRPNLVHAFEPDPVTGSPGVTVTRSTCLMCHSGCGIQVKVKDGAAIKIDGNPYDPRTKEPHLAYDTDTSIADENPGTVCAKGQAGIKELYNPLRVKQPLKRVGSRGSGKWEAITWDQALNEIINGGTIDDGTPGGYTFEGLAALRVLSGSLGTIGTTDLGPPVNQVVYSVGRSEHGRKEFTDRFWKDAYGTKNKRIDHTSICETSHHVAFELSTSPSKGHMKPDIMDAEYIIWFGTSPLEAGFPMQALARKLMNSPALKKMVVVDPRFSTSAAKADEWIPINMGADAAFALGMTRHLLADINSRCDTAFLKTVKSGSGYGGAWCDASYLVYTSGPDKGKYAKDGDGKNLVYDLNTGSVVPYDTDGIDPELLNNGGHTYNGESVKPAVQLLKERANEKTTSEYAAICGVDQTVITDAARDFCGETGYDMHKCCADLYRGSVQHTNGTYTGRAIIVLNWLVGNVNAVGGMGTGGGHWHEMGGKVAGQYNLKNIYPAKVSATGVILTRQKETYTGAVPATRPWFPLALHGNWQEIIPSIEDEYPYKVKCLINHMGNVTYSTPCAGEGYENVLKDTSKLQLLISFTTVMGETDSLSDYILPDRQYLERYSTTHTAPAILTRVSQIRQPAIDPLYPGPTETGNWNTGGTLLEEDVLIEMAKRMGLPGFGTDGFEPGVDLNSSWDWYGKCFENIAIEAGVSGGLSEVMAKGGAFEEYGKRHSYKGACLIYSERMVTTTDSMTGENYDGLPKYEPMKDCMGNPVNDSGYPFYLNTYKAVFHTQSRTGSNEWLMEIQPENYIEIERNDAKSMGIRNGTLVKLTSPTNSTGIVGKAKLVIGKPGVVTISHSYGHFQYGSKPYEINGVQQDHAPWMGAGISANPLMRRDPVLGNITLQDPIGGSASFYDTKVKVEKV